LYDAKYNKHETKACVPKATTAQPIAPYSEANSKLKTIEKRNRIKKKKKNINS
jgi:hypothetical protein